VEDEEMEQADDEEEALVEGRLKRDIVELEGVARSLEGLLWETSRCGDRNSLPTGVSRNRMANWRQILAHREDPLNDLVYFSEQQGFVGPQRNECKSKHLDDNVGESCYLPRLLMCEIG